MVARLRLKTMDNFGELNFKEKTPATAVYTAFPAQNFQASKKIFSIFSPFQSIDSVNFVSEKFLTQQSLGTTFIC